MRTITISSGESVHIADLSFRVALDEIKKDFRVMPFTVAWEKNLDDIDYISKLGVKRRCDIVRALRGVSEYVDLYDVKK